MNRSSEEALVAAPRGATGVGLMLPPAPRPPKRLKKTVLEEDEYLEQLGRIITRDYYPDVSRGTSLSMGLDEFASRYTSEDNASFEALAEKESREHARRYWWSYGADCPAGIAAPDPSAPGLYVLRDGSRLSAERRRLADAAADAGRTDDHAAGLDFATFEPRTALFFPPKAVDSGEQPAPSANPRCRPTRSRASVACANTRFGHEDDDDDRSSSSSFSEVVSPSRNFASNSLDTLVPMTPTHEPASPLVTWGTLAAPPRTIAECRDQIARNLDAKAKLRRPTPSPLRVALDRRRRVAQGSSKRTPRPSALGPLPRPTR